MPTKPRSDALAAQALRRRWVVDSRRIPGMVRTMLAIIDNPKARHREKISAFRALASLEKNSLEAIKVSIFAKEHDELITRLETLEKAIEESNRLAQAP
jgi:hypothetical protein